MMEIYTLTMLDNGNMTYQPRQDPALEQALAAGELPAGHVLVNRLGDPELLHCAVCRREDGAGGCFLLEDEQGARKRTVYTTSSDSLAAVLPP